MQLEEAAKMRMIEEKNQTRGAIEGELERVHRQLTDAEEMFNMLGERLSPALRPASPSPTATMDPPAPPRESLLAQSLLDVNDRLERLVVRMVELRQRVDL